jgi:hypothetical protein
MNLRRQPRKEYNRKNYNDNIFNITDETQGNRIILLQLNSDNFEITEDTFDEADAEYIFLTKALGWKEGLNKENNPTSDGDSNDVIKLAEYLFLTEQMGWRKGLKLFGEKGEEAVEDELQQIHDMEGFQPKHWYELTKEERTKALKYLMYLKEKRDGRIKSRGCADGRPQQ